ncbi:hypothetical protein IQ241_13295 [Romeria aff. gracilis LEGE 07310]|uniref:Uncharacterized protein n=1 Tax=Vasconcelosia minhoensis LEGE 07310 TaxID=915328 RepID=A0A8J7AQ35_9CYAN|nr:hypothetical protein [Romeria aff. gracilis LEGE 07310]
MHQSVALQELAIVVAANNHSPAVVNLEFLKYTGIVPMDWELARNPIYTPQLVQHTFQNGITITAQPNRVIFTEVIEGKDLAQVEIARLARKYVQSLPNLEYEAVGLNPTGHVTFGGQPEAVKKYLNETLLAPGPWQNVGQSPARSTINFSYTLERNVLNLTISEAGMRNEDETVTPVILFVGNFIHRPEGSSPQELVESLCNNLDQWQTDLETYQDIINQNFLSGLGETVLLPAFA